MTKKLISLILSISMLFSYCIQANAETLPQGEVEKTLSSQEEIRPFYNYTNDYLVSLNISNGNASCFSELWGINGRTTKIEITMTLQKKTLLWWSKVESWTTTVNGYYAALSKTKSVDSGTYRVKAEFKVYSGSDSETIKEYSTEKSV